MSEGRASHEVYEAYRKQIEHEDELIGMRNGWLIGGQAFLFAAYAAVLAVPNGSVGSDFTRAANQLFVELPWIGIGLAALAGSAVFAALWQSRQLRITFMKGCQPPSQYPEIMSRGPRRIGHLVAVLVPSALSAAWIWVIVGR